MKSPTWWVEYWDANGQRQREKVSTSRPAAANRMAQIVTDVERQKGGLAPLSPTPLFDTLTTLAAEYREHLEALGRCEKHCRATHKKITDVLEECGWVLARDVTLDRWTRWVADARAADAEEEKGLAAQTVNHYLHALRAFFRWLVKTRKLAADPLAAAEALKVDGDRRLLRRVLTPDEFRTLVDATHLSTRSRYHLDGRTRAALYLVAARTGLRAGVLARLTPEHLRLDATVPHIPVDASWQKNKKAHQAPIAASVLTELGPWFKTRPAGELLWPGSWHRRNKAAEMLRRDLRAAGLPEVTPDGGYDFHALRGQCGTDLALAGVPLSVTQAFLGHSTPTMTAKHYVHVGLADLGAAADQLGRQLGRNGANSPETRASSRPPKKGLGTRKTPANA